MNVYIELESEYIDQDHRCYIYIREWHGKNIPTEYSVHRCHQFTEINTGKWFNDQYAGDWIQFI